MRRARLGLLVLCIGATTLGSGVARAAPGADPPLSGSTDFSGSGAVVSTVRTSSLRAAAAEGTGPRVLVVGTGVQKSLFPDALKPSIVAATAADASDPHGYGTLAAATIFQLLPNATIVSKAVKPADANWFLADLSSLAGALEWARANAAGFDLALLAFPPTAALDPITYSIGYGDYGRFGRGLQMVEEALLQTRTPTQGPAVGIPTDKALRDRLFARANGKQWDAVERFAAQGVAWRRVLAAVDGLSAAGIAVVAPAGDFTRRSGSSILPLYTQTVYGLSALESVITVGAAYADAGVTRVSPISGRGPTLTLGPKPDLIAPSDVLGMLPGKATLPWPDDSARAPLQTLEWAKPGVPPTPCPSLASAYRCVLQGSSMVSAAVVAANLAGMVAAGTPHAATARAAGDDEVLRGIAWAQASPERAQAYGEDRQAYAWEQGAGVLSGLRAFDAAVTPVPLARADLGEVTWDAPRSATVPLWGGGAAVASVRASLDSFIGPDAGGVAVATAWPQPARVTTSGGGSAVTLTASGARAQGGIYAGGLTLAAAGGSAVTVPLTLTQTVPVDVHVDYAYNELQAAGAEGERVEDAGVVLFAGLPTNVGLVGAAFKNIGSSAFSRFGGDPTSSVIIRAARTQSAFSTPGLPASEHGRAHVRAVPPGFYRFHVLTDHAVEAEQARGRVESIGIQLASSGPDGAYVPGANLLVSSCAGAVAGPLGCATPAGFAEGDGSTGLCVARNAATQVAFNVYCREISYAVPSAVTSRAVHLIEHDAAPARSEWRACGVDVPLDGKQLDFATIAAKAAACGGQTVPTGWSFAPKAPDCLGPTERSRSPGGVSTDVTASYTGPGSISLPGRNFPVGVLTYEFKLPALNTYTTAGLALSYVAENAVLGVRFRAGGDPASDSSNGIIAIDGPAVSVQPPVPGAGARGSSYGEWAVMSSNATSGQISLFVIPTAWARGDLDPTKPIARVQLCDVALRVTTFAKQPWGTADAAKTQFATMLDRGLLGQIVTTKSRVRPSFDRTRFADVGTEGESLHFAAQIPKNTTDSATAPHHVRSPRGGPAYLTAVRRWSGARYANVLPAGFTANDPGYGVTSLACAENAADPLAASVCRAWNAARASDATLAELGPDLSVNGRFGGVLAIDAATIARAAGSVAYEIADRDDGGAFESRWARSGSAYVRRFPVGNFYDDAASPAALILANGVLTFTRDPSGLPVLTVRTTEADGSSHRITAPLRTA